MAAVEIVVLSGTVGAGKSTVALALRDLLLAQGVVAADVDVDAVATRSPAPPGDPFNERVVVAYLAAMRPRWEDAGVEVLILPRVVETVDQRDDYARALGRPVRVVRIDAAGPTRHRRLLDRHEPGAEQDWHLARTDVLAAILVAAAVEELVVDNDGRTPHAVAEEVATAFGWGGSR